MALSPLVQNLLAQARQYEAPPLSPLAPLGKIALAAALRAREKRDEKSAEAQQNGLADVLARMTTPPGEMKNITLESLEGPQGTPGQSYQVEGSEGLVARSDKRDLLKKLPPNVLEAALMKNMFPDNEGLVRGRPGDVFLGPDGKPRFTVPGEPKDPNLPTTRNAQFPDGRMGMVGQDPASGAWYRTGSDGKLDTNRPVPEGTIFVGLNVNAENADGLRPTTKQENDLVSQEAAVRGALGNIARTRQLLAEGATFSFTGWLARGADSIKSQAQQMGSLFGAKTFVNGKEVPSSKFLADMGGVVNDALKNTPIGAEAAKSAALRSTLTSLAYSVALSNNPDGRISEADFRNAMNEIAANSGSGEQLNAVLNEVERRTKDGFANLYRATNKESLPQGFFDEVGMPVPTQEGVESIPGFDELSPEEQAELQKLYELNRPR